MKIIKFRVWDKIREKMNYEPETSCSGWEEFPINEIAKDEDKVLMQFTGLLDKNGKEIYEKDILQFSDKSEWYRSELISMTIQGKTKEEKQEFLNSQSFERREIKIPEDYEWLLSSEIQQEWEIIGNIYENPELLK